MKTILIFFFVMALSSCATNHVTSYEWKKIDTLQNVQLLCDSSIVGCYKLTLADSVTIILHDLYAKKQKHYQCYEIINDSLIWKNDFLNLGRGPYEALQATITTQEDKWLYLFTSPQNVTVQAIYKIATNDMSNIFNQNMYTSVNVPLHNSISTICPIDSTQFLVSQIHDKDVMFSYYNVFDTTIIDLPLPYPKDEMETSNYIKSLVYSGTILKHPRKTRFLYSSQYGNYVLLFDFIKGKLQNIKTVFNFLPLYKMNQDGYGFTSLPECLRGLNSCVSDKYIYLLNREHRAMGKEVLIFDWDGNPIRKLILDKEVSYIGVDNNSMNLYAFIRATEDNNEQVLRFNL